MAWYDDPITVTAILLVVIIACGTVIVAMRRYGKKPGSPKKTLQKTDPDLEYSNLPFKVSKSVQTTTASTAKDELRMLDLERDILGDAIRKLYEAHAEGKITEQERDKMAITYKNRMNTIKESISKDEGIVALHELEGMQEDLMKLFSERFGELTSKVEELRTRIDVKPIREIPIKMPTKTPTQLEGDDEDEEDESEDTAKHRRETQEKTQTTRRKTSRKNRSRKTHRINPKRS